ncbi:NADP-dependent oxidoreductase domain-containing protein [Epithele typhae]|uniref:NADP-dependent oxidoreductase domain-containing protein n=1 Tax=Epithele typhae TaxID=378194 RepID=UPI002008008B|nr:NADP-dependent oxidoreductase domain-containing protein [Epithele typhae]KAH9915022.1 NADP-dependent oxidoreductase domain-containing protein [Epithele typhae]
MPMVLLNDGTRVPALGYGTGTIHREHDTTSTILSAISAGFTHLDGAQLYKNEEFLGAAIATCGRPRADLYITTKLNKLPEGQSVRGALEESLRKLRVDYVDMFLIHVPIFFADLKATWREMEGVKEAGLARTIGLSNFNATQLHTILEDAKVIPAVNQVEYHPYVYDTNKTLVAIHERHGIATAGYSGLATLTRFPDGPVDSALLAPIRRRLEKEAGAPVTEAQVLLLWHRAHGVIEITTSSKAERMQEYLDILRLPDLTSAEVKTIDDAGSTVHRRFFVSNLCSKASTRLMGLLSSARTGWMREQAISVAVGFVWAISRTAMTKASALYPDDDTNTCAGAR